MQAILGLNLDSMGLLQPRPTDQYKPRLGIPFIPMWGAEGKINAFYVWFDAIGLYQKLTLPDSWGNLCLVEDFRKLTWFTFYRKDSIHFCLHRISAMLMVQKEAESEYILPPNNVTKRAASVSESGRDKISTSRNWAVWLHSIWKTSRETGRIAFQ